MFPWLTAALLLPILGAVVVALLPSPSGDQPRSDLPQKVALGFSLLTLGLVAAIGFTYEPGGERYQLTETYTWIEAFGAHYALGVDGIGLTLLILTAITDEAISNP